MPAIRSIALLCAGGDAARGLRGNFEKMGTMKQGVLGSFVQFVYGKGLPARNRKPGSVPVYGSAGLIDTHNTALVRGPGIVVGRKGTVGAVHWADRDFYPIDTTYYVVPKCEDIRIRYTYYLLKMLPLPQMNTDVAVPGLNRANALRLMVTVPSLLVQDRIIKILSSYENLIENNQRRIHLLEQAARLLYKEWFIHLRFPGHEHTKIKNGVPEGWERKTLGNVVKVTKGKNITKESTNDGSVPVIAGGLSPAYYHDTANAIGPIITVSASGANAGYVNLYHQDIWASDCSYISAVSTKFLYYFYLLLTSKQREIFAFQKGVAQPHVYPKDLQRLPLQVPTETIVKLFEESVTHNFRQIKGFIEQNKLLTKARDLLLPRLMNGSSNDSILTRCSKSRINF